MSWSEKLYCDMVSRKLYPVREDGTKGLCFDVREDGLVEDRDDEASFSDKDEASMVARGLHST